MRPPVPQLPPNPLLTRLQKRPLHHLKPSNQMPYKIRHRLELDIVQLRPQQIRRANPPPLMCMFDFAADFPHGAQGGALLEEFGAEVGQVGVDFVLGFGEGGEVCPDYFEEGRDCEGEGDEADYAGYDEEGGCCLGGGEVYAHCLWWGQRRRGGGGFLEG